MELSFEEIVLMHPLRAVSNRKKLTANVIFLAIMDFFW